MKKMRKRLLAVSMAAALSVTGIVQTQIGAAYAQPVAGDDQQQEVQQEEIEQQRAKARSDSEIAAQMVNNYHDIDEEAPASVSEYLDTVSQDGSAVFGNRAASDAKFDPRQSTDAASVPAVRNQGALGSCWAHSAMSMVEMNLWKQQKISGQNMDNMSEFQTVFFMNHDWADPLGLCTNDNFRTVDSKGSTALSGTWYENGGNTAYTQFMLMDWVGAVSETEYTDTAYDNLVQQQASASLSDDYAIQKDIVHVKDVSAMNSTDRDVIKQMVADRGAVGISYNHNGQTTAENNTGTDYFNSAENAYYYNDYSDSEGTNHAVAIVGWDDNFSKEKFNQGHQPSADGAWLVRNSWGTGWGDQGYFWISYEERSFADVAYALEVVTKEDSGYYDYNYQYDGGICNGSRSYNGGSIQNYGGIQGANIFTAQKNEMLNAVAIYTGENYDYQVDIYKNLSDQTNPIADAPAATVSGTQLLRGYHTVELPQAVELSQDEIFSVVVTLKDRTNVNETSVFIDTNLSESNWICSVVEANQGESFMRPYVTAGTERSWSDLSATQSENLRIKAYTTEIPTQQATVSNKTDSDAYALTYTYADPIPEPSETNFTTTNTDDVKNWKFTWYSGDQTDAGIDLSQLQPLEQAVPSDAGVYTLAVSVTSRNYLKAETRLKITVEPKQAAALDQTFKAGKNYAHTYTFDVSSMIQDEINGDVAYQLVSVTDDSNIFSAAPSLQENMLTIPVAEVSADAGADIEIGFSNPNYKFENAVLHVELIDKTIVNLTGITFPKDGIYHAAEFTYSGTPAWQTQDGQTVEVSGTDVLYEGVRNTQYSSQEAPKNAGEYKLTFSVKDTDQQYIGTASETFTIAKKGVTVTAKDKNISAGEQIPSLENAAEGTDYVIEGLLAGDQLDGQVHLSYANENGEPVTPDNSKAGTYKIMISGFESSNYELQYQQGTLTITGKADDATNKPETPSKPSTPGSGSSGTGGGGWSGPSGIGTGNVPGTQTVDPNQTDDTADTDKTDDIVDPEKPADPFKTVIVRNIDDSVTETTTGTVTNEEGNTVDITEVVNKNADGTVTGSSKRSVITISQNGISTIEVNVIKDAEGIVTYALAEINATESPAVRETVLKGSLVRQAIRVGEKDSLKVKMRVEKEDSSFAYSVTARAADLEAGNSLYIVIRNAKGERVLVNAKKYKVLENQDVSGTVKGNRSYELINEAAMDKLSNKILKTVQVKKASKTIQKSKTAKLELKNTLNMQNVKSVTYSVNKKSVAAVTKKGVIKGKKAGSAVIKAKVTLKNGKTKTVQMKIKVQ